MTSSNTELMYKMYDTEFDEAELEAAAESSEAAASSVRGLARCRTIVQRFPVMMAYTHEEGRFVYAKMAMGAGDMVMFALPYVWVVHEAYRSKVCSFCIKDLVKIRMPCSTCRQVFYCSRECKNNDHEIHQDECRILASWQVAAGDVYDVDFVRDIKLLVRTLARRTAEKRLRMNKESMSHLHSWDNRHLFKDYCLLQSLSYTAAIEATSSSSSSTTSTTTTSTNATTSSAPSVDASNESACSTSSLDTAEQAAPDTAPTPAVGDASPISIQEATTTASSLDAAQQPLPPPPPPPPPALPGTLGEEYELIRETMARYVTQLRHWLGFKWETEEEMIDIVFRNSRNVFSFNNGRHRAPQATGIYIPASFFNHSCDPNVQMASLAGDDESNVGPALVFTTTRPIEDGEPLYISYIASSGLGATRGRLSVEERRALLRQSFLFYCNCDLCVQESGVRL